MPKIDDFITFKIRKQHPILVIYFIANTKGGASIRAGVCPLLAHLWAIVMDRVSFRPSSVRRPSVRRRKLFLSAVR